MSRVEIVKLKVHADARGAVFEPLEPELLAGWQNVHAVISEPGAVRGNHAHRRGTEISAVVGPTLVRYRESAAAAGATGGAASDGAVREVLVPAGEVWRFRFPPGVAHAFKNTGPGPVLLVSFNTMRHDPAAPDVERVELI